MSLADGLDAKYALRRRAISGNKYPDCNLEKLTFRTTLLLICTANPCEQAKHADITRKNKKIFILFNFKTESASIVCLASLLEYRLTGCRCLMRTERDI